MFSLSSHHVAVIEGRNLVPKDLGGLSDPYCIIKYQSGIRRKVSITSGCVILLVAGVQNGGYQAKFVPCMERGI